MGDFLKKKEAAQFFRAIMSLKNEEECAKFFEDICTPNEIHSLSQRLEVARLLSEGATYQRIEEETGASTATISRVKRSLNYGNKTYHDIFQRIKS